MIKLVYAGHMLLLLMGYMGLKNVTSPVNELRSPASNRIS